jgi:hypothetical protein
MISFENNLLTRFSLIFFFSSSKFPSKFQTQNRTSTDIILALVSIRSCLCYSAHLFVLLHQPQLSSKPFFRMLDPVIPSLGNLGQYPISDYHLFLMTWKTFLCLLFIFWHFSTSSAQKRRLPLCSWTFVVAGISAKRSLLPT